MGETIIPSFIADVHLGRLARRLRLLGFDTVYRNDLDDPEIVEIAVADGRIKIIDRALALPRVPAFIGEKYPEFFTCDSCGKISWEGSHLPGLETIIDGIQSGSAKG